jgi:hypothetical protein
MRVHGIKRLQNCGYKANTGFKTNDNPQKKPHNT